MPDHFDPVCRRPDDMVRPVRVGRAGVRGAAGDDGAVGAPEVTWKVANGPGYRRTGHGLYVPVSAPTHVEQRILEAASCLADDGSAGSVTGWAALRWRGAAYFDGRGPGGADELPVELAVGGRRNRRPRAGVAVSRRVLAPTEWEVVDGLPVTTVQRSLFDEVCRVGELWGAVQAIEMAAAAGLISAWLFATYVGSCNSRDGVPLVREAVSLAVDESRSPRETWMRLVWLLDAGFPPPLVNEPVFDLDGRLIGIPDLLDPVAGVVGEYNGKHHLAQVGADLRREGLFRNRGLEYFTAVRGDSRGVVAQRMADTRRRAQFLSPESRAWTLERPPGYRVDETLDARLERLGLVGPLTRT